MRRSAAFLSLLLLAIGLHAQQYGLRTFSLEEGLPSASVNALCEDSEGFLWIATEQGIARGQGLRFETFPGEHALKGAAVTAILGAEDGRVWCGTRTGGLAYWENGTITTWAGDPLPKHPVRSLLPAGNGGLWLASRGGGVWQVDVNTGKVTEQCNGLPSKRVNALVNTTDERLLAATDSGLAVLEGSTWRTIPTEGAYSANILSLHADARGIVAGTNKGYVELGFDLRPLPIQERMSGHYPLALPHPVVLSVLRATNGDLWIGTPAGLAHLSERNGVPRLKVMAEKNGLGHDLVRCLHQDRSGGIWIGTGFGGVSKFMSDAFLYFTEREGLPSRIVSAIHRTPDGLLWIGTQGGGLAEWDGRQLRTFGREAGLPSLFVTCVGDDGEGYPLVGTALHGLFRLRNGTFSSILHVGELENDRINAIRLDADGHDWIGTSRGLHVEVERDRYALVGSSDRTVHDVLLLADTAWVATDSGLYSIDRARLPMVPVLYTKLPAIAMTTMVMDSNKGLWVGSASEGLFCVRNGEVTHHGEGNGLANPAVEQLQLDAWENLWVGTRNGMYAVELDALQERVLNIRYHGPEDGFIGIEHMRHASMLDGDSTLWFGTVRGIVRYDPFRVVEDLKEPLVHLTDLQLFYEHPDWSPWCEGSGSNGLPFDLELPYNKNHLTFTFTGISLAYPEQVRYRYVLEGYDPDWSPITATERVTYSNIPPGTYAFKVMARNASGIWSQDPKEYSFTVAPPIWQTTPFRLGGGALILLSAFGFVRLRERNLRKDRARLEGMVGRRTSELASEKERSDTLLLNILPAAIAEELKSKGSADAHSHPHCTVLFSDFTGFTTFSSRMDSDTLVSELDHYFRLFDRVSDRYGVEKIKTIGDAYMCASGVPAAKAGHALDGVLMALGMLHAVEQSNAVRRAKGRQEWPIRIGLHSGPVVSGVVGEKKFAYDIWGDTVNLASRMESNSEPGRLNISGTTYADVMDFVEVQPRGPVKVKGKGELNMYYVLRLKQRWSADEQGLTPNEALLAERERLNTSMVKNDR